MPQTETETSERTAVFWDVNHAEPPLATQKIASTPTLTVKPFNYAIPNGSAQIAEIDISMLEGLITKFCVEVGDRIDAPITQQFILKLEVKK
jgi:hypothetical protein